MYESNIQNHFKTILINSNEVALKPLVIDDRSLGVVDGLD